MSRLFKICFTASFFFASSAVFAHTGHFDSPGFLEGFLHPFTGADHLAAMLAVGVWSAMTTRRVWAAPLAFASLLLVGALLGCFAGFEFPAVESMIAASLLVVGLLLAVRARLPLAAGSAIVGIFALFHGAAHGIELASSNPFAALAGMVLGTALIHIAGVMLGFFLNRQNILWARIVGGSVAFFGMGLLTGVA